MSKTAQNLPQPTNMEELAQVLAMIVAPDNAQIKQGTAIMKIFLKNPACVQPLMMQITSSPNVSARQMAAVLLRRKIGTHFTKLPKEIRLQIQNMLLDRLVKEEQRLVRISIASLISAVARKTIPDGEWSELMQFLLQCFESSTAGHREVAMMLFRALAENIEQDMRPHFPTLLKIFTRGMQDPAPEIRKEALKAIGVIVESIESPEEVAEFRHVIPHMVDVVKKSIVLGDEEAAVVAFEAFDSLADSPAPVISMHIPILVQLMAEVMVSDHLDMNIREKASLFVVSLIENKAGKIVLHNLVDPLLTCCFRLCVEPFADSFEVGEMTPQKLAVEILDSLALNTPKQRVYELSMQNASGLLQAGQSEHSRKGGLVIIAVLAEGLAELLKKHLPDLLRVICSSTKDPSSSVRSAAAVALTQFSDYLQPEVLDYHEMVLPHVFELLKNPQETLSVKKRTCTAVEVFTEHLNTDLLPYTQGLMEMLVVLLRTGDTSLQESAVSAMKSVAKATGEKFLPFFPDTIRMMGEIMTRKEDDLLNLRAQATECVGCIALAVGKEAFQPFLNDFMKLVIEGTTLDYFQLREAAHNFFANIALLLGPDFAAVLPLVMPLLLATCRSNDGVVIQGNDGAFGEDNYEGSDSDDDEEDDYRRLKFTIRSGALDEKVAAVATLGTICSAVGEATMPFLEAVCVALDELVEYPHCFVRSAVMGAFNEIFGLMFTVCPNAEKHAPGKATAIHPQTQAVLAKCLPLIINRMQQEEEKEVAAAACEALYEAIKNFGLGAIQGCIDEVYEALMELVAEKAPCQTAYEEDDPENMEHDEVLIDSVTDVVGVLATVVGDSYEHIFRQMFPHIMKFCKDTRNACDRSMAIGCIAEVAEVIGAKMGAYLNKLFPTVLKGCADESIAVRRNSAYCLGVICANSDSAVVKAFPQCATALQGLFNIGSPHLREREQVLATRDNAVSALCKMVSKAPDALPLHQMIPLILSGCPLEEDKNECKYVYPCIINLIQHKREQMQPHMAQVGQLFTAVVADDTIDEELRRSITAFMQSLS